MIDTTNPFILRLRRCGRLDAQDEAWLLEKTRERKEMPAHRDLKSEGEKPVCVHIILEGLGCRYKILPDGRRQITAFLVPGDPCDFPVFLLDQMDHSLCLLTKSVVATIDREEVDDALTNRPLLTRAFWRSTLMDEAILREWLVNIGRRNAYERVCHLLWELFVRHALVGLTSERTFTLPLTQVDLADSLGLSAVHMNRTLQRLKSEGLIGQTGRSLTILRPEALQASASFDNRYLHTRSGTG